MEYRRKLTPPEVKILGDDPREHLHAIIDDALQRLYNAASKDTVESKVLNLISDDVPMTTSSILESYEAVHGEGSISLNYLRSVLQNLLRARLIKRVCHGQYVKEPKR